MSRRRVGNTIGLSFFAGLLAVGDVAQASHGHSHHSGFGGPAVQHIPPPGRTVVGGGGGGFGGGRGGSYGGGFGGYGLAGYYGGIAFYQPSYVIQPMIPVFIPSSNPGMFGVGGPMPTPTIAAKPAVPVKAKKADASKSAQLMTIGDRMMRVGNTKRAADRYEQALRADGSTASIHVRLAQVALVRGQYSVAADHFREAVDVEPNWLSNAHDIQAIFGEPAEFRKHVAKLESHLLKEPNDRDGWLVLGAELYLTGQIRRSSDVFLRLTDRKPDAALSAFLDATKPAAIEAR